MAFFDFNSGEPFGFPKGTVRGLIAISLAGTLIQQTLVGAIDPITFLGVAGPFLGYYVATRPNETTITQVKQEDLPEPYIGGVDGDAD